MPLRVLRQPLRDALVRQRPALRMPVLALVPVRALLPVGTRRRRRLPPPRLPPQKIIQRGPRPPERVVRRHEPVVHEREHEHALLDHPAELGALLAEVAVVVVAHDDAVDLGRELEDVAVVVADHALAAHEAGGREDEQTLALEFGEDFLVGYGIVGTGGFLAPLRDEYRYFGVAARLEPVDADFYAAAREGFFVSVTVKMEILNACILILPTLQFT